MTPRQATVLLVFTLVTVVATAAVPVVHAQDAAAGPVRLASVRAVEEAAKCPDEKPQCWDIPIIVIVPGDHLQLRVDLEGSAQPHDFHLKAGGADVAKVPEKAAVGGTYTLNYTIPESAKTIDYYCAVHPSTMTGKLVIQSELGATEETPIPELGVHFLSYWVGLIAFMLLFIVYGATFFLFKYNETPETTDHWERAGEGAPDSVRRFSPGMASTIAILLSAILIAAVIYLARR